MMTVADAASLLERAAEKSRSGSLSAAADNARDGGGDEHCALGGDVNTSQDDSENKQQTMPSITGRILLQEARQSSEGSLGSGSNSPRARLKAAQQARRSQSCKVSSSKNAARPLVRRRTGDEDAGSAAGSGAGSTANVGPQEAGVGPPEEGGPEAGESYNPFLRKVPSCGKLLALEDSLFARDDTGLVEDSPVPLRRCASARRPPKQAAHPDHRRDHSPTPPRGPKQHSRGRGPTTPKKDARRATAGGGGFLEVRDPNAAFETLDSEQYLLRNFQTTHKGSIINRGDSFRRRRSRSNSVQPPTELALSVAAGVQAASSPQQPRPSPSAEFPLPSPSDEEDPAGYERSGSYRVPIIGAAGVGKTALINQFRTSECINAYDCPAPGEGDDREATVSIVLNSYESEIVFVNVSTMDEFQEETCQDVAGWVVVYSITDKASFQKAGELLEKLKGMLLLRSKAIVIVGNKCELVRSRAVNVDDGRELAISYGAKFMEISVGMNHKCDDLLVGILHQLRLKEEAEPCEPDARTSWTRNRSLMRASRKAKRLINRVMGKSDSKYKSCEDFNK